MKRALITTLLISVLLAACSPATTPNRSTSTTHTLNPTLTCTPEPTTTGTPEPTQTPIINEANFKPPVDPLVVPLYNAFDLDSQEGIIEPQNDKYPARTNFQCNGKYFSPGTPDNHFAWDYGTGNCSKHLVGTPVYGMSVGFQGVVLSVSSQGPAYPIVVDYGKVRWFNGVVRNITIQFAHSLPLVEAGDKVDSSTPIAQLEEVSVEVEIQVLDEKGSNLDPHLIGLRLPLEGEKP